MVKEPFGNSCLYYLKSPTGKGYVGFSDRSLKDRLNYGNGYKFNAELDADIHTYGIENFEQRVVLRNYSPELVRNSEAFFIKHFDTQWPHGYNKDSGGKSGYHRCQQTKDKISAARRKPIAQIDIDSGAVIQIWPSIKAAAQALKINAGHISEAANGRRKTAGGYKWQFVSTAAAGDNPAVISLPEGGHSIDKAD